MMLFTKEKQLFHQNLYHCSLPVKTGKFSSHRLHTKLLKTVNVCLKFGLLPAYAIWKDVLKSCTQITKTKTPVRKKSTGITLFSVRIIKGISLKSTLFSGNTARLLLHYKKKEREEGRREGRKKEERRRENTHTHTPGLVTLISLFILTLLYSLCMLLLISIAIYAVYFCNIKQL